MFGFPLLWEACRLTDLRVVRLNAVGGSTSTGKAAYVRRFNHRCRVERLRLAAAVRRSDLAEGVELTVSWDLKVMAYGITVRRVVWRYPLHYTESGQWAYVDRFNFRYRFESLRLWAAVRRGELDFIR